MASPRYQEKKEIKKKTPTNSPCAYSWINPHFNLSSKTPAVTVLRVSWYCSNSISSVSYRSPRNLFTRHGERACWPSEMFKSQADLWKQVCLWINIFLFVNNYLCHKYWRISHKMWCLLKHMFRVFLNYVMNWMFTKFVFPCSVSATGCYWNQWFSRIRDCYHQSGVVLKAQFLYPLSHAWLDTTISMYFLWTLHKILPQLNPKWRSWKKAITHK